MSNIEWTEETWQVTSGCTMVSPGCARCYAETMAKRLKGMAQADIAAGRDPGRKRSYLNVIGDNGKWNDKIELLPNSLTIPLKRKKPTTWFVNSMSDLFHEGVPFDYVDRVFAVMALTPQHTYQVLTKRPERMAEYFYERRVWDGVYVDENQKLVWTLFEPHELHHRTWPLPNVWLGTSVEDQKRADERIPHLLRCPAAVRFLSVEPLLGAVDLNLRSVLMGNRGGRGSIDGQIVTFPGIDWVIVGGESGPGARPMNVEWARSIVRQCKDAGVACFVKQMGADPYHSELPHADGLMGARLRLKDAKGGDPSEWPADLWVREMPLAASSAVAGTGGRR